MILILYIVYYLCFLILMLQLVYKYHYLNAFFLN